MQAETARMMIQLSAGGVGELFGHPGTSRTFTVSWIEIFRMQGGRATEGWLEMDTADFLRQLDGR